jgi:hypothetical protein
MVTAVYIIMSIIHLFFLVAGIRLFLQNRSIYTLMAMLVIAGLFYDNFIIGIGRFIGEGSFLQTLNAGRFYMHALFTPLLIMFAIATAQRLGINWAQKRWVFAVFGVLTLLMIAVGVNADIINLSLVPEAEAGTLRYINANTEGPPIPAIVTVIVMIVVGGFIWRLHKWSVLFFGSLLMFIASGAGASILLVGNIGEILFSGSIVRTDYRFGDVRGMLKR